MRPIYQSFYAKLSIIFLLLILALGVASIFIAFSAAGHLFDAVEQLLNREYAASIALELDPLVGDGLTDDAVPQAIHYMMVLNPMVEIYLLDSEGAVIAYFTHPYEQIERYTIDLEPITRFVSSDGEELVLGDDPRGGTARKPFSAAELQIGDETGYVYVILRGNSYDRSVESLRSSYYLRTGFFTFLIALIATLGAGLSIFFFLTQKLRRLSGAVESFELGELSKRVDVQGADEIGDLGRAFNEMADSVERGVENLRAAETERSEMIANISHDLRSPLTSIRGNIETVLLKDASLEADERRELLEVSLRNVSGFQKLVEDLFELARLENGQVERQDELFSLGEIAQDVVMKLRPRADAAQISIIFDEPTEMFNVRADVGMIDRVFTNLIENAIRYTPSGGSITISLDRSADLVRATVSDTGSGISPDDLPHVFERFYRADKSRNRNKPGTGLGLAIVKQIVELHGGSISAKSTPEIGTIITFSVPFTR